MMVPGPDLRARVLTAASAKPSRTRREGKRLAAIAVFASIAVALLFFELAGGVDHSRGRSPTLTFALAGGWSIFAAVLSWSTLARRGSTLTRLPLVVGILAFATPLVCFAWMHVFAGSYAEPFTRVGYRCFALTLGIAALPLLAFLLLRRGIEPRTPSALGAGAGAMTGAWAGVLVDLWCPLSNDAHAAFGHALPLAVLVAVGAWAGRKMLGLRRV